MDRPSETPRIISNRALANMFLRYVGIGSEGERKMPDDVKAKYLCIASDIERCCVSVHLFVQDCRVEDILLSIVGDEKGCEFFGVLDELLESPENAQIERDDTI